MEFDTRKDQIDYVVRRLLNWVGEFLEEGDRDQLSSVPASLYSLVALEITKNKYLSELPFWDAIEKLKGMFPSRADSIEAGAQIMSQGDRDRLLRFVRVLGELIED
jgi:hypothetical protein